MAKTTCILCGGRPTTDEHLISKWMSEVLDQDARTPADPGLHISYTRYYGVESRQEWRNERRAEFVAKVVCGPCNDGWMGKMETDAQPAIGSMIRGQPVILDRASKDAVAKLLTLKAIIARYIQSPITDVAPDILRDFYTQKTPRSYWHVRITRYIGNSRGEFSCDLREITRQTPSGIGLRRHRWLFTFVVGYFGAQVFIPEQPIYFKGGVNPGTIICWPSGTESDARNLTSWPPKQVMTDHSLELMREMLPNGRPR